MKSNKMILYTLYIRYLAGTWDDKRLEIERYHKFMCTLHTRIYWN